MGKFAERLFRSLVRRQEIKRISDAYYRKLKKREIAAPLTNMGEFDASVGYTSVAVIVAKDDDGRLIAVMQFNTVDGKSREYRMTKGVAWSYEELGKKIDERLALYC